MKAFLLFCLFVALNCDIMEIIMCFASKPVIMDTIKQIIEAVKEKDLMKIVSIVMSHFMEFKEIIEECIKK